MEVVMAATETDDGPDTIAAEQLCAQIERWLHAHTIQHQAGPTRSRDRLYPLGRFVSIAVVDDVVGAKCFRLFQFLAIDIRRDDGHGSKHSQELDRHVSESANPENDGSALSIEVRERTLDRMVRSQRGIAQRRRFCRTQTAKRHK